MGTLIIKVIFSHQNWWHNTLRARRLEYQLDRLIWAEVILLILPKPFTLRVGWMVCLKKLSIFYRSFVFKVFIPEIKYHSIVIRKKNRLQWISQHQKFYTLIILEFCYALHSPFVPWQVEKHDPYTFIISSIWKKLEIMD